MKIYLAIISFLLESFLLYGQISDSVSAMNHLDSLDALQQKYINQGELDKFFGATMEAVNFASTVFGESSAQYAGELFTLGAYYQIIGQIDSAQQVYERLVPIVNQLSSLRGLYSSVLMNLGEVYISKYSFEAAEQMRLEALSVREQLYGTKHRYYAESAMALGAVYVSMRKFKKAEEYYLKSIQSLNQSKKKDDNLLASVLFRYGELKYFAGDFIKAEDYYLQSFNLFQILDNPNINEYVQLVHEMGVFYHERGNFLKAEEYYTEALQWKEKIYGEDHLSTCLTQMNLGNMYAETKRYVECDSLYHLINNRYDETGRNNTLNYVILNINYAHVYLEQNKNQKCDSILNEILHIVKHLPSIPPREYREILQTCGALKMELGDLVAADSLLLIAHTLIEADSISPTEPYLQLQAELSALYYLGNDWQEAEKYRTEFVRTYYDLVQQHTLFTSESELEAYIQNMDRYLASYFSYLYINPASTKIAEALELAIYNKGFMLYEIQTIKKQLNKDSVAAACFEDLTSIRSALSEIYAIPYQQRPPVDKLEQKANDLEKKIISRVAEFKNSQEIISWTEIQQKLAEHEAYIVFHDFKYFPGRNTDSILYCAFLLRPDDEKPIFIPLFEKKQLDKFISSTEDLPNTQIDNLYGNTGLYSLLWASIDSFLQTTKTVYYSLSGLLHKVNVEAIYTPHNVPLSDLYTLSQIGNPRQFITEPDNKQDQKLCSIFGGLIYDLDTSATNLLPDLANTESQTNAISELSFSTNPTLRGNDWIFLEGSVEEIHQIGSIFKKVGYSVEIAEKESGTEEVFKQISQTPEKNWSPRIIHISTHGFFYPEDKSEYASTTLIGEPVFKVSEHPMIRSGLILAGGNYAWTHGHPYKPSMEDGILTAYEISQMDLTNTELVVLSACETGLGDIKGNEGVYGLQRAFKIAGAKNLIMSLWKVPDAATAELMISFYKHWLEDKMTIRQALYTAQKELRDDGFEPYYWAGWVLVE